MSVATLHLKQSLQGLHFPACGPTVEQVSQGPHNLKHCAFNGTALSGTLLHASHTLQQTAGPIWPAGQSFMPGGFVQLATGGLGGALGLSGSTFAGTSIHFPQLLLRGPHVLTHLSVSLSHSSQLSLLQHLLPHCTRFLSSTQFPPSHAWQGSHLYLHFSSTHSEHFDPSQHLSALGSPHASLSGIFSHFPSLHS